MRLKPQKRPGHRPGLFAVLNVLYMFCTSGYRSAYARHSAPPPATADEIADTLSSALRYQERKRVHHADDAMTRITAERLVQHLEASGFVLMKGPPRGAPTTAHMPPSGGTDAG